MRRAVTLFIVLVFSVSSFAQVEEAMDKTKQNQRSAGHEKGQMYIMPAVGLAPSYGAPSIVPPLLLNLEYGIHDMFSIGAFGGYGTAVSHRKHPSGQHYWRYNYVFAAARLSFHWGRYLNVPDELDLYGRAALGWRVRSARYEDNGSGIVEPAAPSDFGLIIGIHAGAKYMFTPALGAFLEVGHDNVSNVQLGLAFKL